MTGRGLRAAAFPGAAPGLEYGTVRLPYGFEYEGSLAPLPMAVKEDSSAAKPEVCIDGLFAHGQGTLRHLSVLVYRGDWKFGKRHGNGEGWCASGMYYVGSWDNGYRHGVGRFNLQEEEVFYGVFFKDMPLEGRGMFVDLNDDMYEGNFENGTFEGEVMKGHNEQCQRTSVNFRELAEQRLSAMMNWKQKYLFVAAKAAVKKMDPKKALRLFIAGDCFEGWYNVARIYEAEFFNHLYDPDYSEEELQLFLRSAGQAYAFCESEAALYKPGMAKKKLSLVQSGRKDLMSKVDNFFALTSRGRKTSRRKVQCNHARISALDDLRSEALAMADGLKRESQGDRIGTETIPEEEEETPRSRQGVGMEFSLDITEVELGRSVSAQSSNDDDGDNTSRKIESTRRMFKSALSL